MKNQFRLFPGLLFLMMLLPFSLAAQTASGGSVNGRVTDQITGEGIPFATVNLQGQGKGATCDADGRYIISGINPGLYNITAKVLGYKEKTAYEIEITNVKQVQLDFALESDAAQTDTVEITASPFNKTAESPVSLRTIGASEIERYPGGNRDISKVLQSLPGVASTASFRNDIIIRGGAPNENRFYLDGIEVPNINHFATQGSSGGPVGMLNVNFLREVDFYSGAFPANRGNTLSSVMEFKMKDGNEKKLVSTITAGASDYGLTLDGPLGDKASLIFSVRRSYLQLLFKALELPFLPIYNDAQFKVKIKATEHDEITLLGLGAFDNFELNTSANETEYQKYLLDNLPVYKQWNYTGGATWKHFFENSVLFVAASRNYLDNRSKKYYRNDESSPANLLQDYHSTEGENKLRIEHIVRPAGFKIQYGALFEQAAYTSDTYQKIITGSQSLLVNFNSTLDLIKGGFFAQASRAVLDERLSLAFGVRGDFTNYSSEMSNPLQQLSPRLSASLALTEQFSFNFNTGRYYQLPAYTVMGYRDSTGNLVNKINGLKYIRCDHIVAGFEWNSKSNAKISVEGFYKNYANYPFLLRDSISLANLGADFGVIGNAPVTSTSQGRAYGIEFLAQQKLFKGFYGIVAYTWVRSEFSTRKEDYAPSAWDNGHIITLTGGKKFKKNWEIGVRWRFLGGAPYTPVDAAFSSLKQVWDVTGQGVPDYTRLNSERYGVSHQMDIRADKKWYMKRTTLDLYLDVQNLYNFKPDVPPILIAERDADGNLITDPNNPAAYKTKFIEGSNGSVLPTVGIIFEF